MWTIRISIKTLLKSQNFQTIAHDYDAIAMHNPKLIPGDCCSRKFAIDTTEPRMLHSYKLFRRHGMKINCNITDRQQVSPYCRSSKVVLKIFVGRVGMLYFIRYPIIVHIYWNLFRCEKVFASQDTLRLNEKLEGPQVDKGIVVFRVQVLYIRRILGTQIEHVTPSTLWQKF